MITKCSYYCAPEGSHDPYRNLAREELFLGALERGEIILYLWQNKDTVVIGRNQNCYKECRVSELEEDGGHLARRLSGGGAVFHDLGNMNFTIITGREDYDVSRQTDMIRRAVESFGVKTEKSGRNDITAGGRKFSGNAYYLTRSACYHHGTLLVNVDNGKIGKYLNVSRAKLKSKGVASVSSRVASLTEFAPDITVADLRTALKEALGVTYGLPVEDFDYEDRINQAKLDEITERYASDEWKYGSALPAYNYDMSRRFDWGEIEISLAIKDGSVIGCKVYTDALDVTIPEKIEKILTCAAFEPSGIRKAFEDGAAVALRGAADAEAQDEAAVAAQDDAAVALRDSADAAAQDDAEAGNSANEQAGNSEIAVMLRDAEQLILEGM